MDFQRLEHVVRRLSPAKQAEVLDFAEFLAGRDAAADAEDQAFYAAGLRFAAEEMGDDPVEYGPADVRDRS